VTVEVHEAENVRSLTDPTAVQPTGSTFIAVDLSAGIQVSRPRKFGTSGIIVGNCRVKLTLEDAQGGHRVAHVGASAKDPTVFTVEPVHTPLAVLSLLVRSRVQIPFPNSQCVDHLVVPRSAPVGPFERRPTAIHPEKKVPRVGLRSTNPGPVLDGNLESRATLRVVFADEVSRKVLQFPIDLKPSGDGESACPEVKKLVLGNLDIRLSTIERSNRWLTCLPTSRLKSHTVVDPVETVSGTVSAITLKLPMRDWFRERA